MYPGLQKQALSWPVDWQRTTLLSQLTSSENGFLSQLSEQLNPQPERYRQLRIVTGGDILKQVAL
jgi:hypothetical protein